MANEKPKSNIAKLIINNKDKIIGEYIDTKKLMKEAKKGRVIKR